MDTSLNIPFSEEDEKDLREFKDAVAPEDDRRRIKLPPITAPTPELAKKVEEDIARNRPLPRTGIHKLPEDLVEAAKATFVASGGNISQVAKLHDLTTAAVIKLASEHDWPVYEGGTISSEGQNRAQLRALQQRLWLKIETMLGSLNVEEKKKNDIVQHRSMSEYVEPLSARNSTFKTLMDAYMRVGALLEPEVYVNDPEAQGSARLLKDQNNPGGIEGVNRELSNFFAELTVGIADRLQQRDAKGYEGVVDVEGTYDD